MTIFDWFKQVTYVRDPWSSFSDEDKATFNPYMMHRLVSMYEPYIELANYLQQFWQLKPDQIYLIYCNYLPENKVFAKYTALVCATVSDRSKPSDRCLFIPYTKSLILLDCVHPV